MVLFKVSAPFKSQYYVLFDLILQCEDCATLWCGYFGSPVLHAAASLGSKWACKKKRGAQNTCMLGHILEYAVLSIDTAMLMEAEINLCKSILRLG